MENIHFLIAGGIALLCCAVLFYYYVRTKHLLDEMWCVQTYDAVDLKRLCMDGFDAVVEVQGAVSCDKPILSFVGQVPCCWLRVKVRREESKNPGLVDMFTDQTKVPADTNWVTEMDRIYSGLFKVEDKTGYTLVNPEGADVETIELFNGVVTRGESWLERLITPGAGRYHVTEEAFLPTGYAYVLGQATKVTDDVMVHRPERGYIDPNKPFFVISRKTEKELTGYRQITVNVCFWFGIIAFIAAAFCFLEWFGLINVV